MKSQEAVKLRNYGDLVDRYDALLGRCFDGGPAGEIDRMPVYHMTLRGDSPAPQRWLLGAGMHGDEPAGHLALLEFLEQDGEKLRGRVDLDVMPCINPWGYEYDRRENSDGIDINRCFEEEALEEVRLCKGLLESERFDLFLEFHEDWEFEGYYLFEVRQEEMNRLGPALIDAIRSHGPIYRHPEVEGFPVMDGVADATPPLLARHGIGSKPLPLWLFHAGVSYHTITSETPSKHWDADTRIATHLSIARNCVELLTPA